MSEPKVIPTQDHKRRTRGRNLAMLWTLLGLVALFFAITIVQVARR
ncbi:hypothetical protein ACFSM5_14755 [Lacibacterium aquatile]|uniref:Uncharacterized protein n=1 Tax=Lacibacterium aquatile TaxID=1168082 RepID=A0ABW5DUM9_9PROT